MATLRWHEHPDGDAPVMVAAFEGWNDAGDAATTAVGHMIEQWDATPVAEVDPEEFYDFTVTRPHVHVADGVRQVSWPANELWWARPEGSGGIVLVRGVEPQLRWRTFCSLLTGAAEELGVSMVVTLGALLAEVAHTRDTPVFGTAYDEAVIDRLGLEPSRYEGPTGIVGVLHAECTATGLASASLWAAVPSYVPSVPSPKAALALVERTLELVGVTAATMGLRLEAAAYEHEISELVAEDDATVDYVRHLEELHDRDAMAVQSADDMVSEVERFLREQ
jgi:predicted ATP-grasp superfamily ATP-dependent carboligase